MIRSLRESLIVAATLAAVLLATPAWAVNCQQGYQRVNGQLIATPYCQDQYLAKVARGYGLKASAAKVRNTPDYEREICRTVFSDFRVQTTCQNAGVPEYRQ